MTYLMFLFAALTWAACAGLGVACARCDDLSDKELVYALSSIIVGVAAIVVTTIAILVPVTAGYDKRQCYRYGNLTSREVKYQRFSYWTWDCYVRTRSGNWISKDQVRGVDQ